MPDLYLILHKVRGEPAFDIARKLCQGAPCQPSCGGWDGIQCTFEDDWIIPTSGHIAHPYWTEKFNPIFDISLLTTDALQWEAWPDHYQVKSAPSAKVSLANIIANLTAPKEKIRRI